MDNTKINIRYSFFIFLNRFSIDTYDEFMYRIPSGFSGLKSKFDVSKYIGIMRYYYKNENNIDYSACGVIRTDSFINYLNIINTLEFKENHPLIFTFNSLYFEKTNNFPETNILTLITPQSLNDFDSFKFKLSEIISKIKELNTKLFEFGELRYSYFNFEFSIDKTIYKNNESKLKTQLL